MIAALGEIEGPAGETLPAVRLGCRSCGELVPVFAYDGTIPPLIAPAVRILIERWRDQELPGSYTCAECAGVDS